MRVKEKESEREREREREKRERHKKGRAFKEPLAVKKRTVTDSLIVIEAFAKVRGSREINYQMIFPAGQQLCQVSTIEMKSEVLRARMMMSLRSSQTLF